MTAMNRRCHDFLKDQQVFIEPPAAMRNCPLNDQERPSVMEAGKKMTEVSSSQVGSKISKLDETEALDVAAFAMLTLIPKATVLTLRSRSPERLPPPFRQRPLRWRRQTVVQWMKDEEGHEIERIARLIHGVRGRA